MTWVVIFWLLLSIIPGVFAVFASHKVLGLVTILHIIVLNLPSVVLYKCKLMIQIAMIPATTVPADFWSFLEPIIKSLEILQADKMVIKTPTKTMRAKVHVLMATDNILALTKLACHAGHTSKNGCCICNVVRQTSGHGQYFRTLPSNIIRILGSFRSFNPDIVLCKGLKEQSLFASLTSFTDPFFFALDEMHGLCHRISKQI
ncbi:hypothetical protein PHYBLDRAFT_68901 [Phycomyces blakesleeanus NRRL 1555(-)]|uniref:Uncharacterized protein n=1 Tax=Phycomyces blakesleeanus (strain ATCC 8743b / DSM 1359 / FGSC 10004 / NBRC 33097 / NRRL 1555) TaxID=763407 RepID=A0A167KSW4_PHYB8|nr:hypothetical protein PHYBLDRAFT_68901 [Phycomyces blakesleeanus NRRL 1555(-)]OAD68799.1 hypothetical protein PHYBLDRAFT_68901 [Phycomyces blakesleeanus NRRL 1555(-)]|eukprot:XP_018286839.1 hypothetical protein PHYBLDRAFT_68901 [Phycomyces blakesleeanus NRRL 1555(-)]